MLIVCSCDLDRKRDITMYGLELQEACFIPLLFSEENSAPWLDVEMLGVLFIV